MAWDLYSKAMVDSVEWRDRDVRLQIILVGERITNWYWSYGNVLVEVV